MGGACGAFRVLVGKSEGKKTLGILDEMKRWF
jgi:hypothetical protein